VHTPDVLSIDMDALTGNLPAPILNALAPGIAPINVKAKSVSYICANI
jgi:hypothetical protein